MISVDEHFPFDSSIPREDRLRTPLPEKLRGIEDRTLAQLAFEAWLATNPQSARRYETHNPPHWNGT